MAYFESKEELTGYLAKRDWVIWDNGIGSAAYNQQTADVCEYREGRYQRVGTFLRLLGDVFTIQSNQPTG